MVVPDARGWDNPPPPKSPKVPRKQLSTQQKQLSTQKKAPPLKSSNSQTQKQLHPASATGTPLGVQLAPDTRRGARSAKNLNPGMSRGFRNRVPASFPLAPCHPRPVLNIAAAATASERPKCTNSRPESWHRQNPYTDYRTPPGTQYLGSRIWLRAGRDGDRILIETGNGLSKVRTFGTGAGSTEAPLQPGLLSLVAVPIRPQAAAAITPTCCPPEVGCAAPLRRRSGR